MKYEVLNSHLLAPDKVFKRGEVVTPDDLTGAGFDVDFLLNNKSIEPLKGSYDDAKVQSVKKVEAVKK